MADKASAAPSSARWARGWAERRARQARHRCASKHPFWGQARARPAAEGVSACARRAQQQGQVVRFERVIKGVGGPQPLHTRLDTCMPQRGVLTANRREN